MYKLFNAPVGPSQPHNVAAVMFPYNHIGKLADNLRSSDQMPPTFGRQIEADGTPIQPVLPSGNPMPKMVERETNGVECPDSKEDLVH